MFLSLLSIMNRRKLHIFFLWRRYQKQIHLQWTDSKLKGSSTSYREEIASQNNWITEYWTFLDQCEEKTRIYQIFVPTQSLFQQDTTDTIRWEYNKTNNLFPF